MKKLFLLLILVCATSSSIFAQSFREVSLEMGVNQIFYNSGFFGGGAALFDYNNDGYTDIYMTGGLSSDRLYRNEGNGKFTDVSTETKIDAKRASGSLSMGVITGDFNNDGFEDIYVTFYLGIHDFLYKNLGNGTFEEIGEKAGFKQTNWSMGACFIDVNNDGYLDVYATLYSANTQEVALDRHSLYINNKNETFTESAIKYGVQFKGTFGLAVQATDFDLDNDLDIMVANDFGMIVDPNKLYENLYPKDSLKEMSAAAGVDAAIYGMGIGTVDIDEDGDFDYYVTSIGKNRFFRNNGNKTFDNIAEGNIIEHGFVGTALSTSWSPIFIDYNNDTHPDLAMTTGFVGEPNSMLYDPNKLWKNSGMGVFTDVTAENNFGETTKSRGMAMGDLNNDGMMDLVIANLESDPGTANRNTIYLNQDNSGNKWFKVKLIGKTVNRSAIGCRATAYVAGRQLIREVEGGGGNHLSHSTKTLHWGMAKYNKIDSLKITWLGGTKQTIYNLPTNVEVRVTQNTKIQLVTYSSVTLCKGSVYEGTTYNNSQKVVLNKTSIQGYDSLVYVYVKVNPTYDNKSNVGICKGDSYRGMKLTKDTVFVDNLKTFTGCDSVSTFTVTINMPSASIQNLSFCDVADYDGKIYTTSRAITKTTKNVVGCDSVMTVNLTVNKSKTTNETVSLCSGDSYLGKAYTSDNDLIIPLKTSVGCDSVHSVSIKVKQEVKLFRDTLIFAGAMYDGVKYDSADADYEFSKIIKSGAANGCDSTYIVKLRVRTLKSVISENQFASLKTFSIGNQQYQIAYSLSKESPVQISILNTNGIEVLSYNLGHTNVGDYKLNFNAQQFAKGAYFITMKLNSGVLTQKLIVVE